MSLYEFQVKSSDGSEVSLKDYSGKVLLIVNTASACGFTPQYEGLQKLYSDYRDRGLEVLAFPCNQFGAQEPGSDTEIQSFCTLNYSIQFKVFSKIDVNGSDAHPLYQFLKKEAKGLLGTESIKWNFTKFLVSKTGEVIKRYAPQDKPDSIRADIEEALSK